MTVNDVMVPSKFYVMGVRRHPELVEFETEGARPFFYLLVTSTFLFSYYCARYSMNAHQQSQGSA
eukprot:scaffold10310_cov81-Cylindrotheca_fusiformis.AAC.4